MQGALLLDVVIGRWGNQPEQDREPAMPSELHSSPDVVLIVVSLTICRTSDRLSRSVRVRNNQSSHRRIGEGPTCWKIRLYEIEGVPIANRGSMSLTVILIIPEDDRRVGRGRGRGRGDRRGPW